MYVTHLSCWACKREYSAKQPINLCECGKPLKVEYDLQAAARAFSRESLAGRVRNLWRYREVLPMPAEVEAPTLGEGGTPLISAGSIAESLGCGGVCFSKTRRRIPPVRSKGGAWLGR